MKSRTLQAGLLAVVVALVAYWYWSPYLAVWQIRNAAQSREAASFNAHVDYPKLRDSMKNQFAPLFMDTPSAADGADGGHASAIGKAGAAFGKMLGLIVVDKAVDLLVRPEVVMQAMREGYMTPQVPQKGAPAAPSADGAGSNASAGEKRTVVFERNGVNSLLVYAEHLPDSASDVRIRDKLGFVFERSGFATWKLSGVMLPIHAK